VYYCEPCRKQREWPVSDKRVTAYCQCCGKGPQTVYNVTAMALPMPDPNLEIESPFLDPPADPRAQALQEQRDAMAAGKAAATSIAPNYEKLKLLTRWLAENGWDAIQIADAVARPSDYWVYYAAANEGGDIASGH
jgi:hypothetical protein